MPAAAATTVTPTQFEKRRSVLRHLDGYAHGIVSGVRDALDDGASPVVQSKVALAAFTDEVTRSGLDPDSVDHALAWGKFKRQLSRVVGGSVADGKSNTNGEIE